MIDRIKDKLIIAALALGAVILVAAAITLGWQAGQARKRADALDHAINAPVVGYKDQLTTCRNSRLSLEQTVAEQNKAVETLEAEAKARTDAAKKALADARAGQRAAEGRVRTLLREQPRAGETQCEAADRLILENAG